MGKKKTATKAVKGECAWPNYNDLPNFNRFINEILENRKSPKKKEVGKDNGQRVD